MSQLRTVRSSSQTSLSLLPFLSFSFLLPNTAAKQVVPRSRVQQGATIFLFVLLFTASPVRPPGADAKRTMLLDSHTATSEGTGSSPVPLFVFGDSQLDVGNNNFLNTSLKANFPPYGLQYINSSGRFCNGKLIPDLIADYMGIPSPQPYFQLIQEGRYFSLGANFASAGAGVLNSTNAGQCIPISGQLSYFRQAAASGLISQEDIARGIFLVNIGANDLSNLPFGQPWQIPGYLAQMSWAFAKFLEGLLKAGARKLIVLEVVPVGCAPIARAKLSNSATCIGALNSIAWGFNSAVIQPLGALGALATLTGIAKVVVFNQYDAANDLIQNYQSEGYTTLDACCGGPPSINGLVQCGRTEVVNGTAVQATLCSDIGNHLFWDFTHPAESVNQRFAKFIWEGSKYTSPAKGASFLFQ